jgi:ribulose-phosphate 3-epimerase
MTDKNKKLKIEIIPALLPDDFGHLKHEIDLVDDAVDWIQIDVVDGKFAPTKTWPYNNRDKQEWERILSQDEGLPSWEKVNFEIDLMVEDQLEAARDWISAGVARVIAHIESFDDESVEELLSYKEKYGVEIVLSLVPSTDNSVLDPYLDRLDGVQFMGNDKIGHHGVELDESVLEKIAQLRSKKPEMPIGIDIGVNEETVFDLYDAGVTRFSSGSMILQSENPREKIREVLDSLI